MPSKILKSRTPIDILQKEFPQSRVFHSMPLHIFGCTVFIKNPDRSASKLDPKGKKCVFLGIAPTQKGYKCFDPVSKRIFVTMDTEFFESKPFFTAHLQGENNLEDDILFKEL